MKTITFYSFKGGVGRSLMLSNMALWLADEMKAKVCVIDFDLEAPGLPYKFEDLQNPIDQERLAKTEGIVEYIDEFNQTGYPPADFTRFYLPFTTSEENPITLIPAGNLQETDYWRKLFDINWQQLFEHDAATGYSKGLLLLEDLKGRIEAELAPDFLLIDSRTGLTETASITLKLMADKAILVGINNRENQDGLFWVLRSLHADPASRDLPYHLVLNRVPMKEREGRKEIDPREKAISTQFLQRFENLAPIENLTERFSIIHSDDEQAFGEKLQEGFYVEAQPKVQIRKDYWDVFAQVTKEYFMEDEWALFERKRKAYELYYKAKFDIKEIQEQINLMNEAIGYCDDDAFLYSYRFLLYYDIKNFDKSLSDIKKAIDLNQNNLALWFNLGVFYYENSHWSLAIDAYHKILEKAPYQYEIWNNLGGTYKKTGNMSCSIKCYEKALKINPNYHQAWYNLGVALDEEKVFDNAIQCFRKALDIMPNLHEAWNNLGTIYNKLEQFDLGMKCYYEALKIKPEKYETINNIGVAYRNQKDYKNAIKYFTKGTKVAPEKSKSWEELGFTFEVLKKYYEASNAYTKALKIEPNYHIVQDALAGALIHFSYEQESKFKTLQKALRAAQKSQQLGGKVYHLSCVHALLNNKSEALRWLQQALVDKEITVEHVQQDRDFASLREDEDFKALLAKFSS